MTLNTAMQAALDGDVAALFVALEILHPAGTIRLLDGAGVLSFDGKTFTGQDDAVGALGAIDVSADSDDDQAPTLDIVILPANMAVAAAYAVPEAQGSAVSLWVGCYSPATGQVIGEPDLRFYGTIDTVQWNQGAASSGADATALSFEAVSGFEQFFETDEGTRLGDAFHQSVWPGEKGFQYFSSILDNIPWGVAGTRPSLTSS